MSRLQMMNMHHLLHFARIAYLCIFLLDVKQQQNDIKLVINLRIRTSEIA